MADIKKFLDQAGVSTLWGQVTANIAAEKTRAEAAEKAALEAVQTAQADVDNLETLVGVLPEGVDVKTVVEYVNKKTEGIVTDAALAELQNAVDVHTTALATLNGGAEVAGSVTNIATKVSAEEVEAKIAANEHMAKKYEITSVPTGTLVDYRDKEIRVMCPVDTQWVKQSVGGTGNPNMYYMGFKAYAPEGAVSFKEGDRGVIIDEMFDFNGDFAGTDEYGRNYSICWLALAIYDAGSDTWTYFGKNSSEEKFIGWDYIVEWYDSGGAIIASDCVRINLSNEDCHFSTKSYYVGGMRKEIEIMVDQKIAEVAGAIKVTEF